MTIRKTDLILEIGSGDNPRDESHILCDRFVHDNSERAGEFSIRIDRPFVVADGMVLPFADKSFDVVICSHILEHMDNPEAFIQEVTRVGKRGIIEVPSALSERIFGWDFHHWYLTSEQGQLIMRKKVTGERFGGFFHQLIANTIWFRRFFEQHETAFYLRFEWKDICPLRVETSSPPDSWIKALDKKAWSLLTGARPEMIVDIHFWFSWMSRRIVRKCKKIFRGIMWKTTVAVRGKAIVYSLLPSMRCVACRSINLAIAQDELRCHSCRQRYPIDGVVPVMLTKKQVLKGY